MSNNLRHLQVGDYVPYFKLRDHVDRLREIQLYVGGCVAMFFLPQEHEEYSKRFLVEHAEVKNQLLEQGIKSVVIIPAGLQELREIRIALKIGTTLWSDQDSAVMRMFGGSDQPFTVLAGSNLKIENIFHPTDVKKHIRTLRNTAQSLLSAESPKTIHRHAPVMIIPDALDRTLCKEVVEYWQLGKQYQGTVGVAERKNVDSTIKRRIDVDIHDVSLRERVDLTLSTSVFPEIRKVGNCDVTYREMYKIGCYSGADEGFYKQHRDTSAQSLSHRRYSMSLVLNEDYEGGGLVFPEYGTDIYRPQAGTAIVFPSTLMHKIEPVTVGRQFVLVSFFYGDREAKARAQVSEAGDERSIYENVQIDPMEKFEGVDVSRIYTRSAMRRTEEQEAVVTVGGVTPVGDFVIRKDTTPPGVLIIDNYLTPGLCKRIVNHADLGVGKTLGVFDHEKSTTTKSVMKETKGRVTEQVSINDMASELLPVFIDIYANRLAPFFDVEFEWFERPQILRYPPGGKYNRHADSEHWDKNAKQWVKGSDRDYSILVYLNENYVGGELRFIKHDYKIKPTTGMLIAFPSDHNYLHAAEPTNSGIRYVMVSWAAALGTVRVKDRAPYASTFLKIRPKPVAPRSRESETLVFHSNRAIRNFRNALLPCGAIEYAPGQRFIDFLYFDTFGKEEPPSGVEIGYALMDRRKTLPLDDKTILAHRLVAAGMCDPMVYFDAQSVPKDSSRLWFVKDPETTGGKGINVVRTEQLAAYYKPRHIIQEAVSDIALIDGRKFTIRAHILVCDCKLYLYREGMLIVHGKAYDPESTDFAIQVQHHGDDETGLNVSRLLFSILPNHRVLFDDIAAKAPGVFSIFSDTLTDANNRYCLFGVDYLPRPDGTVALIEINHRPNLRHPSQISEKMTIWMLRDVVTMVTGRKLSLNGGHANGFVDIGKLRPNAT